MLAILSYSKLTQSAYAEASFAVFETTRREARKKELNSIAKMPTSAKKAVAKVESALVEKSHAALDTAVEATPAILKEHDRRRSALPPVLRFPLAATLSFAVASLGYSFLGEVTKGELATVSRSQDTWAEVGVLAGWRLVELAIGWFGELDSLDVATMDLLSHGPTLYLQTAFYALSPTTAVSALLIDVISAALPFYLLRPVSYSHRFVFSTEFFDPTVLLYTTALSSAIYAVTLVLSLTKILPSILAVHFAGLPTLVPAYEASYFSTIPVTLAFGFAASVFIFAPFAAAGPVPEDEKLKDFDPASATLGETVYTNVWGYTAKTKVVIRRTTVAVLVTAVNTYLACTMTIYGIRSTGALAYAGVWAFAALCTGLGLGLVGGE